ncbi:hypothetical protein AVEN_71974-1 [Araneus ventricosus]|uniref:Uncharacterized protein n=1 Tax=Araneus ventricosus TaxID=182803 RepID=A0A4Y2QH86_ARAVE|nr:hypothetical protein AVEN_173502-1 [Araneus ventricosus]GBN51698.1 hypothetical protein AVEN_243317-1 [Araneus ventricosus]GBN51711.1 hypothetical protein AVEN_239608-1 [Araneus ventricosus]GBN62650.1 hypothetical protein AVEN_2621-1 [Araneus ventricosus]GBN71474.1 hypothetical protein AVEN_71974-1 [Araneus ventricosus]
MFGNYGNSILRQLPTLIINPPLHLRRIWGVPISHVCSYSCYIIKGPASVVRQIERQLTPGLGVSARCRGDLVCEWRRSATSLIVWQGVPKSASYGMPENISGLQPSGVTRVTGARVTRRFFAPFPRHC